jgi:hypothetical protein
MRESWESGGWWDAPNNCSLNPDCRQAPFRYVVDVWPEAESSCNAVSSGSGTANRSFGPLLVEDGKVARVLSVSSISSHGKLNPPSRLTISSVFSQGFTTLSSTSLK